MMKKKKRQLSNKERAERMAGILLHKDYYNSKDEAQKKFESLRIKHVKELCGDTKNKRTLDVGIGDGFMAKELGIKNLWAIDISPKRCKRARKLVPNAKIMVMDAQKMGFKDNFFDGTICADVLEHTDHPDKVIKEMIRVTRKGGFIVVSVPNEPAFILARILKFRSPFNPDHIHWVSRGYLIKKFKRKYVKTFNIPNLSYPLCLSQCYKFIK